MNTTVDPLNPEAEYAVPKGESRYLKFEEGATEFMPLASAIIGWSYWNKDNKPVRFSEKPEGAVEDLPDIRTDQYGNFKLSHFWVFPVIECATGKVKILEITQGTVQQQIRKYALNEKWGSPVQKYTFTVDRDESGNITKYSTMANPLSETPEDWMNEWKQVEANGFDLNELYSGGDPFKPAGAADAPEAEEEVN